MSPTKLAALVMLVSLMLQCGLMVNRKNLVEMFKQYGLFGRALLVNFILIPLFAVILVRAMHLGEYFAIGILLMAIAPGAPFFPRMAGAKAGGSLSFALALCVLMPAISIVTVPLTVHWIFPPDTQARVPVTSTIVTLVAFQLIPILIGIAISERFPQVAAKVLKPVAAVVTISLIVVFVLIAPVLVRSLASVYGSNGMITSILIVLFSLGAGWLLGGPAAPYRNTLAIAAAMRNIGLALVIATADFKDTPVAAMVISYLIAQIVFATIAGKLFTRHKHAVAA